MEDSIEMAGSTEELVRTLLSEIGVPYVRLEFIQQNGWVDAESMVAIEMIDERYYKLRLDRQRMRAWSKQDFARHLLRELETLYSEWLQGLNWRHMFRSGRMRALVNHPGGPWTRVLRGLARIEDDGLPLAARERWEQVSKLLERNQVSDARALAADALTELAAMPAHERTGW